MSTAIQPKEKALVFVSYAREDEVFVDQLVKKLDQYNVEPVGDWLLTPGEKYEVKLRELNLRAQCLIFVITPDSIKSQACLNELATAVESKKQVLPVSRRDHGEDSRLDSALRAPQWIFLREHDDFDAGVQEMVKAINTDFDLMEMHGRLLSAAESWSNNGKNRSYLLRKDGLKEAEVWLGKTSVNPDKLPQPTALEVEYILASQRARSRGTRIAIGVALAIVIALSVLSVVALVQRTRARTQQAIAEENARRAVEVGKRRLVIATLLVNPEGTQFTTLTHEQNDLMFGLEMWELRNGTLKNILQRFQNEEPATFVQIFADGDAAKAQRLIAYTGNPGQTDPEFNLIDEQWLNRFRKAGANPALQAVQLRDFTEVYLRYLDELNRIAPIVKTERGLAFLLDIAYQIGTGSAKKVLEEAQQRPAQNESELLARVKELTVQRVKRFSGPIAKVTERRRQTFLASPYLSDQELGF
jgi:TIR domain.